MNKLSAYQNNIELNIKQSEGVVNSNTKYSLVRAQSSISKVYKALSTD